MVPGDRERMPFQTSGIRTESGCSGYLDATTGIPAGKPERARVLRWRSSRMP